MKIMKYVVAMSRKCVNALCGHNAQFMLQQVVRGTYGARGASGLQKECGRFFDRYCFVSGPR